MNERQYNSKLISDKLSEIPVPANDLLWSKIEAQLLAIPPHAAQAPDKVLLQQSTVIKTGIIKVAMIILSSAIILVFVIWLIGKTSHPQKTIPARQIPQIQIKDSLTDRTSPDSVLQQKKKAAPVVIPVKQQDSGKGIQDTEVAYPALLPLEKHVITLLTDSLKINPPGTIQTSPDTAKIKGPAPQKDEDYYFDMQKKRKGNRDNR